MTTTHTTTDTANQEGHAIAARLGKTVSDARAKALTKAATAGATDAQLATLASAAMVNTSGKIILPAHRYESCSRGRGWCRSADGTFANERSEKGGYVVCEAGKWTVGATDGFSREARDVFAVRVMTVSDLSIFYVAQHDPHRTNPRPNRRAA